MTLTKIVINVISSSKVALVLVLLLILLSIAGAVLPQEGLFEPAEVAGWQAQHPFVTSVFRPIGLFRAFHSVPFLIIICLLAINTLTCTIRYFYREGGISALKGSVGVRLTGFIFLHLSLILLFSGGFWSAGATLDGYIVLTEGQTFKEEHSNYLRLVEGPLRTGHHRGFLARLKKVRVEFHKDVKRYPIHLTSTLEFRSKGNTTDVVTKGIVEMNRPFTFEGLDFTQDKTGFSPRLLIREKDSGRVLVNTFVALKTFRKGQLREYRDFLPLPFFKQRVIVTLYPNHKRTENGVEKTGEEPENPVILVETETEPGQPVLNGNVTMGNSMSLDKYEIGFIGLRRWSSFRVVEDPAYTLVWIALWLGVAALILRYIPDIKGWFKNGSGGMPASGGQNPFCKKGSGLPKTFVKESDDD